MPRTFPRAALRQSVFFLLAVLVPSGLLVLLTLRTLVQDRELADKRAADERARLAADIRQDLLSYVERIRLSALNGEGSSAPSDAPVLLARVDAGRLVLPWESGSNAAVAAAALNETAFRDAVAIGEQHEFQTSRFTEAAAAYSRATEAARLPVQKAAAQVMMARALTKDGRGRDALAVYRRLLDVPPDVVDDQGMPFAMYAVRRLAASNDVSSADKSTALVAIRRTMSLPSTTPSAAYMANDALTELALRDNAADGIHDLRREIDSRIRDLEQALELQRGFATLGIPRSGAAEPVWATFGPSGNIWLMHVSASSVSTLTAIRAASAIRSVDIGSAALGDRGIVVGTAPDGDSLTPNFPGLTVSLSSEAQEALAARNRLPRSFYPAALSLVVSLALFCGYLFWRDVRREVRLAEMRSQFVSSVSHELRTPLTAIRMFAETLLLGRSRPEVSHEYLETIVNESERLTRLLNNVLDFSKIEQGKKAYRLEPQSLPPIVRTAVKTMQYPAAQQGFDLRLQVDEGLPRVNADSDAIEQAILNLLTNAMKYSGESRVIELTLLREDGAAVLSVTDHGIGIPSDEHTRIFDKFYRVRDGVADRIAGTGLGLALVDHVARAHGARITVTSAPGVGSTFSLIIPLMEDDSSVSEVTKVPA